MPVLDLAAYKPVPATLGDANQIANGFQAIVTVINALDQNNWAAGKIFDPAKLMQNAAIDGDPLVWDNTLVKWVPASTLAIGRPRAPRMFVSTMAGGPPASPVDQDIWVATAVDANGTRWAFQYDSTQATYKWVFVGGPPLILRGSPVAVINTMTQVAATGWYYNPASMAYTTARAGDYSIDLWVTEDANGAGGQGGAGIFADVTAPYGVGGAYENLIVGLNTGIAAADRVVGIAAAKVIGGCCQSSNVAVHKLSAAVTKIVPVRVI